MTTVLEVLESSFASFWQMGIYDVLFSMKKEKQNCYAYW